MPWLAVLLCLAQVSSARHDHSHSSKSESSSESGEGVGCYVCSSVNGSNPDCHDDFNRTQPAVQAFYKPSCSTPKFDRTGRPTGMRFARRCYKLKADRDGENFNIVVRDCDTIVEGGDPHDTIATTSYNCPTKIVIGNMLYSGCLLTCDSDGCNYSGRLLSSALLSFLSIALSLIFTD